MPLRQALITYDPELFRQSYNGACEPELNWIFGEALSGRIYPRERGIHSIRHIPEGNEIIVAPVDGTDILMSFNPCITLPLDLLEDLVAIADEGAGISGAKKEIVRLVREEIAGTRKRFEQVRVVAVPRVSMEELETLTAPAKEG